MFTPEERTYTANEAAQLLNDWFDAGYRIRVAGKSKVQWHGAWVSRHGRTILLERWCDGIISKYVPLDTEIQFIK